MIGEGRMKGRVGAKAFFDDVPDARNWVHFRKSTTGPMRSSESSNLSSHSSRIPPAADAAGGPQAIVAEPSSSGS